MLETNWLTATDPTPMLRYLIGTDFPRVQALEAFPNARGSDRKLRLFASACYRRISRYLPDPLARDTVEIAERFADGAATEAEFLKAEATVHALRHALEPRWRRARDAERAALRPTVTALGLAGVVCWREPQKAAWYAASNAHLDLPYLANPDVDFQGPERYEAEAAERRAQCELLREIFGNPFHPIAFAPEWRTDAVISLATQMYTSRDFSTMPTFANTLQNAGCRDESILHHCSSAGPHIRGCWVVDLALDRK